MGTLPSVRLLPRLRGSVNAHPWPWHRSATAVVAPLHASAEVYGDIQDLNSLVEQAAPPRDCPRNLTTSRGSWPERGTDRTSYAAVPPITPDFFARSAGKARR